MVFSCLQNLFSVNEELNRFKLHNCNFKFTQTIRLIFMLSTFAVWGLLLYVWAKAVIAQFQFWILTFWLIAVSVTACSSGREVVEVKMLEKIKTEKLKDGSIQPEQAGDVELPKDEKSNLWKTAILFYSFATPLVIASPIMYLIFEQSMFTGEVCKLYELSNPKNVTNPQGDCIKNYANKD